MNDKQLYIKDNFLMVYKSKTKGFQHVEYRNLNPDDEY